MPDKRDRPLSSDLIITTVKTVNYCISPPIIPLFIVSILLFAIAILVILGSTGALSTFITQVYIMTLLLIISPTAVHLLIKQELLEAIIQASVATIVISIFVTWILGIQSFGFWVLELLLIFGLFVVGAYPLSLLRDKLVHRLKRVTQFTFNQVEISRLRRTMNQQVLVYASLPIGFISATVYGEANKLSHVETLLLAVPVILGVTASILVISLFKSAVSMSNSLILFEPYLFKTLKARELPQTALFAKLMQLVTPQKQQKTEIQDDYSKLVDMAYLVSDLRKIYFYDSVHNSILLICLSIAMLSIVNLNIVVQNTASILMVGLLVLFLFCYLPYSVGQYQLHETIIESVQSEGVNRKELKASLKEASPLYPHAEFLGALAATGTIGGFLSALAHEFIKNAIK